jgi:hypothetical protein
MTLFYYSVNVLHKILIITNRAKNEPYIQYDLIHKIVLLNY